MQDKISAGLIPAIILEKNIPLSFIIEFICDYKKLLAFEMSKELPDQETISNCESIIRLLKLISGEYISQEELNYQIARGLI